MIPRSPPAIMPVSAPMRPRHSPPSSITLKPPLPNRDGPHTWRCPSRGHLQVLSPFISHVLLSHNVRLKIRDSVSEFPHTRKQHEKLFFLNKFLKRFLTNVNHFKYDGAASYPYFGLRCLKCGIRPGSSVYDAK